MIESMIQTEADVDGRSVVAQTSLEGASLPIIVSQVKDSFDKIGDFSGSGDRDRWTVELNNQGIIAQREPGGDTIFFVDQATDGSRPDTLWIIHATHATTTPHLQIVRESLGNPMNRESLPSRLLNLVRNGLSKSPNRESLTVRMTQWKETNGDWRNQLKKFENFDGEEQDRIRALISELLYKIEIQFTRESSAAVELDQTAFTTGKLQYLRGRRRVI